MLLRFLRFFFIIFGLFNFISNSFLIANDKNSIKILVTIKPIYSLVKSIIGDQLNNPKIHCELLMDGTISPHEQGGISIQQAHSIKNANIVVAVGPSYEAWLNKYLRNTPQLVVFLENFKGLLLLPNRFGNGCHCNHACATESHHKEIDGHFWLHPENAIIICQELTKILCDFFPEHTNYFNKRLNKLLQNLKNFQQEITTQFKQLGSIDYVIYHDCLQYFDKAFGTQAVAALVPEPANSMQIKNLLNLPKADLLLTEPQIYGDNIKKISQKINLPIITIDYLGLESNTDENAYFNILQKIADDIIAGYKNINP